MGNKKKNTVLFQSIKTNDEGNKGCLLNCCGPTLCICAINLLTPCGSLFDSLWKPGLMQLLHLISWEILLVSMKFTCWLIDWVRVNRWLIVEDAAGRAACRAVPSWPGRRSMYSSILYPSSLSRRYGPHLQVKGRFEVLVALWWEILFFAERRMVDEWLLYRYIGWFHKRWAWRLTVLFHCHIYRSFQWWALEQGT